MATYTFGNEEDGSAGNIFEPHYNGIIYTFENIVINGVDTSKIYNDSTLPIRGVKRIICNGEDKLHKNVNTKLDDPVETQWSTLFIENYKKTVLDKVNLNEYCVTSIHYIKDGEIFKGFTIEFEIPVTFYYSVSEDDTVLGGGWVSYTDDTVENALIVQLEFVGTQGWQDTLKISATNTEGVIIYNKTIEPNGFDLGMSEFQFTIKGRVY